MKRIVIALLLAVGMNAAAQVKTNDLYPNINLGLIPTPQEVIYVDSSHMVVLNKAKVKEVRGEYIEGHSNLQGYELRFKPGKIELYYTGEEGRQYAYMTLAQLKVLHEVVPSMTIFDWPAYKYRGWMDDQSRGPVPHAAYRKKQWERLHALKYNFCNYYTEHTLYQPEFPDLAPAYLADCKPHPDEVINLQLFAHAEKTLRVPFYQYMMDSKNNFNPASEATYDFLRKRIAGAFERIPNSPFFIINCDETEQLGTGRAKALVDRKGADQVYVDHINRCYELIKQSSNQAIKQSPRVAMWGDIVAKNPAMMRQLPKDMIYIMWAYEPLDSFKHLIKPFKEQGNPFWVAASTGHSATMTSTPQRYIKNIANLYRDGYRDGAEGAMLTCWDDNGEALFDNSWHAQYWAAEMAWNPLKTNDPEEFARREKQFNENFERLFYGSRVVGDSVASKTADLYAVGALMYNPVVGDWYTSAALLEPLLNFNPENTSNDIYLHSGSLYWYLTDSLSIDSAANPHAHYAVSRMIATGTKAVLRKLIFQQCIDFDERLIWEIRFRSEDYLRTLFNLKREYLRLWDQENGDYERYIVCNRYDALAREVLELDRHVFVNVECGMRNEELNGASANSSFITQHSSFPYVTLRTLYNDRPIYYTLDGSEPDSSSTRYERPFPLERSATIRAIAYNKYGESVVTEQYLLSHHGMGAKITLNTQYSTYKAIYSGGGENALIDGQLGSNATYADGHWQGYWGDSIDAVIDLGTRTSPSAINMRFMQNTFDWILAPTQIKVYASQDGKEWTLVADKHFDMDPRETGMRLKNYTVPFDTKTIKQSDIQAIRVVVPNPGPLPVWHPAPGQPSYIFTDEIIIK